MTVPPGLYALPAGVDFPAEVVRGLRDRIGDDPAAIARAELYVNTRRMQRRIRDEFARHGAGLLPRLRLVTDPANDPRLTDGTRPLPKLRRRLDLARLVTEFLAREPDLKTSSAVFDLSDSLSTLIEEMRGEGVTLDDITALDVSDESGHWARALRFLTIAMTYLDAQGGAPDPEARLRAAVSAQIAHWQAHPPQGPVIVAGSTGSRGTTAMLMEAVARLPQGAVILPGVDTYMDGEGWAELTRGQGAHDHPQYRFADLAARLGCDPTDLPLWTNGAPASRARNRLMSLALRPAPVTDAWRRDGPHLTGLAEATEGLSLLEAPSPRMEAEAIALRLRHAVDQDRSAALVTPDRVLTRQVAAALDRYGITADDSAGEPLHLSPPGRLLRQAAGALCGPMTAPALLALLKHPLTASGSDRADHLRLTRTLELELRRVGPPNPDAAALERFCLRRPAAKDWADWITSLLGCHLDDDTPLDQRARAFEQFAERLATGPGGDGTGLLWHGESGAMARQLLDDLITQAPYGPPLAAHEFDAMLSRLLSAEEVRRAELAHPLIRIWGTLESRVQNADVTILAGLNEGSWPQQMDPDPWLNRRMRLAAGLLPPDRRIGLLAHDFQQSAAGAEVIFSRAIRSDESETVPARWINRLTNLLAGLPDGAPLLEQMKARGARWTDLAARLDRPERPVAPAVRPSPRPPACVRPRQLRITDLSRLTRDPYAIYARLILNLAPVDPLTMSADARTRGIALHEVMERWINGKPDPASDDAARDFLALARDVLADTCPWPVARLVWLAQLSKIAPPLIQAEQNRLERAAQSLTEIRARITLPDSGVTLVGRADRIDISDDGRLWLYDYKTGSPPSQAQQETIDKQLLVEAAIAERGGFEQTPAAPVAGAAYLRIGAALDEVSAPLDRQPPDEVWAELERAMATWADPGKGYTARAIAESVDRGSDFDQLSRYGEWDMSTPPDPEDMG